VQVSVPYALEGDPEALERALDHLLRNSWEVPKERWKGSAVKIEATYDEQAQRVAIVYTDGAGGLDRSVIDRLFSGRRILSHKAGGTGYGLVYVLNTVRNHGGDLEIRSNKRQGTTTFRLWLPAPRPPASAAGDRGQPALPAAAEPARMEEKLLPADTLREGLLMARAEEPIQHAEVFRARRQAPGGGTDQPKSET
jgi:hypothetical protein